MCTVFAEQMSGGMTDLKAQSRRVIIILTDFSERLKFVLPSLKSSSNLKCFVAHLHFGFIFDISFKHE